MDSVENVFYGEKCDVRNFSAWDGKNVLKIRKKINEARYGQHFQLCTEEKAINDGASWQKN